MVRKQELFESVKAKEFSKSGIYTFANMTIEECESSEASMSQNLVTSRILDTYERLQ